VPPFCLWLMHAAVIAHMLAVVIIRSIAVATILHELCWPLWVKCLTMSQSRGKTIKGKSAAWSHKSRPTAT
jgi:hypothetical protein